MFLDSGMESCPVSRMKQKKYLALMQIQSKFRKRYLQRV